LGADETKFDNEALRDRAATPFAAGVGRTSYLERSRSLFLAQLTTCSRRTRNA
jgi:hypothetical protein